MAEKENHKSSSSLLCVSVCTCVCVCVCVCVYESDFPPEYEGIHSVTPRVHNSST